MTRRIFYMIAVLALMGPVQAAALAQAAPGGGSACRPPGSASTRMVTWLTRVVTGADIASIEQRTHMKLPQVPASQITYVTDKNVCNKAVSPYNANSRITRDSVPVSPSGQLYVVKVGNVYVASDPAKTVGHFVLNVTLDSKFKVLASGLG